MINQVRFQLPGMSRGTQWVSQPTRERGVFDHLDTSDVARYKSVYKPDPEAANFEVKTVKLTPAQLEKYKAAAFQTFWGANPIPDPNGILSGAVWTLVMRGADRGLANTSPQMAFDQVFGSQTIAYEVPREGAHPDREAETWFIRG